MNDLTVTRDDVGYRTIINAICELDWPNLDRSEISLVAWAYYYFSIQFRTNLMIAHRLYPGDAALSRLVQEECETDNLSPWPGVAEAGEKLNHDEFMKRLLTLSPIDDTARQLVEQSGQLYLARTSAEDDVTKAMSIASYEDGGLERVFGAILQCQCWDTPLLEAFRHFLVKHIGFDSDPDQGHGALTRHLAPDDRIRGLWSELFNLFVTSVPRFANKIRVMPH